MTLFNIALVLHIAGIVLIAGITFTSYILSRQFWNYMQTDKNKAIIIHSTALVLGRLTAIGGALTILSGITMVAALHGAFTEQTWFRIKTLLVLIIIINTSVFAGRQNKKLQRSLSAGTELTNLLEIKAKMNAYYFIQFILLLTIFILSVFRFG